MFRTYENVEDENEIIWNLIPYVLLIVYYSLMNSSAIEMRANIGEKNQSFSGKPSNTVNILRYFFSLFFICMNVTNFKILFDLYCISYRI